MPLPAPVPIPSAKPRKWGEPAGAGVDVDRAHEHSRVRVEDRLGAVAVVGVDVDHGDRAVASVAQTCPGRGGIVQVARAAECGPGRMVADGRHSAYAAGVPGAHRVCGRDRDVERGPSGVHVPGPIRLIVS